MADIVQGQSDYDRIVVGTDGSPSSLLAVQRAARLAAAFEAELVIGCAYFDDADDAENARGKDATIVVGLNEAEEILSPAIDEARTMGVKNVRSAVGTGSPVRALMSIVAEHGADLLVVGNRGINSLTGRLLGSVPADVARLSNCDVMIVHTVD